MDSMVFAVANGAAGRGRAADAVDAGRAALAEAGLDLQVRWTERPRHAMELVRGEDLTGVAAVAAVGGDGTTFEVLQGLMAHPEEARPPLALVPAGSGNSVALDLGWRGPKPAWQALVAGHRRRLDLARIDLDGEPWYALNVLAWGAGSRINERAERLRWARGLRYDLASLLELLRPRLELAGARVLGHEEPEALLGVAALTQHSGRGMRVAPKALLDDGLLDLVTFRRGPRLTLLKLLAGIHRGAHLGSQLVTYQQLPELQLELEPGSLLTVDGELLPARQARVRVLQRALEVCAPPPLAASGP